MQRNCIKNQGSVETHNEDLIFFNQLDKNIVLKEDIREYSVFIDSKDRNYQVYQDPFNYTVKCKQVKKTTEIINGEKVVFEEPTPVIQESFTNVKYLKLEKIILPYYTEVKKGDGWILNRDRKLSDHMYVTISLADYNDINYRSTNEVLGNSFAIIYHGKKINETHYEGEIGNGCKIFPDEKLGKIDKLKISFANPYGFPIKCPHLDKKIKSNPICHCDVEPDDNCYYHNIFHPLNPLFQHHIHFKIGVVHPSFHKMILH